MATATLASAGRISPIDRQVEAFEESWVAVRGSQNDWQRLGEMVNIGLALTNVLHLAEYYWADLVYRGVVDFDTETENEFKALWARWLEVTRNLLARVDDIGRTDGAFGLSDSLREKVEHISRHVASLRCSAEAVPELLRDWQSPKISAAVGLRDMTLTSDEARDLEHLSAQAEKNPPPMPKRTLPTKDASFLTK
jgi:hypothetical protein